MELPSGSQQTKLKTNRDVNLDTYETRKQIKSSSEISRIKPPQAKYVQQSFQQQDIVDPIRDCHSDVESPGSSNRPAEAPTSEGNLRTGLALETDADQARDDERDNFSLNDEEDGEEYDEFGEDEESTLGQNENDPIVRDDLK